MSFYCYTWMHIKFPRFRLSCRSSFYVMKTSNPGFQSILWITLNYLRTQYKHCIVLNSEMFRWISQHICIVWLIFNWYQGKNNSENSLSCICIFHHTSMNPQMRWIRFIVVIHNKCMVHVKIIGWQKRVSKICPSDPFICLSNLFAAARIYHSQKMEYQNTFQPTISCDIICTSTKHT